MQTGLTIKIVDPDEDYIGIEVCACNGRFAGTTFLYAGLDELAIFTRAIVGFPSSSHDARRYTFGNLKPGTSSGFASIEFRCTDSTGHAEAIVKIDSEEDSLDAPESMTLRFLFEAHSLDRFIVELKAIAVAKRGAAVLLSR